MILSFVLFEYTAYDVSLKTSSSNKILTLIRIAVSDHLRCSILQLVSAPMHYEVQLQRQMATDV